MVEFTKTPFWLLQQCKRQHRRPSNETRVALTRMVHLCVTDRAARETCLGLRHSERRYVYQEMKEKLTALKIPKLRARPSGRRWQRVEDSGLVAYATQETHLALTTSTLHFLNCYF